MIPQRPTTPSARSHQPLSLWAITITSWALLALCGCPLFSPPNLGVTPGGQQDIVAARSDIQDGGIPDPDWITVEGFLSEHSLPIDLPEGAGLVFADAKVAWNADFDVFVPVANVVIGLGTTLDTETFQRDPLNLCLVIDRSESMGDEIDPRSGTSKLDTVNIVIDRILAHLNATDRVSVVSFNSSATKHLDSAPGDDIAEIKSAYETLEPKGNSDLGAGMRKAYNVLKSNRIDGLSDRLIVLTDTGLRWTSVQAAERFLGVMNEFASQQIGATIFGIGADFTHDVVHEISQVRGGNYFFLNDYERIVSVIDNEFDFLVTPVAYDVRLDVDVPFEFDVVGVYGVPVEEPYEHALTLEIPTLFLSSRQGGGAIMIRVRPGALVDFEVTNTVANVALSYTTPEGVEETQEAVLAQLPSGFGPGSGGRYFGSFTARRAVLLLNTALVIKNACDDMQRECNGWHCSSRDRTQAINRLTEFLPYFDGLAQEMEDRVSETSRSLSEERTLVEQLLTNVRAASNY